jgi:hypothetical protein
VLRASDNNPALWVAAERLPQLEAVFFPIIEPAIVAQKSSLRAGPDDALMELVRGRLEELVPRLRSQMAATAG